MDSLLTKDDLEELLTTDYLKDATWLDEPWPEIPPLSEEEKGLLAQVTALARARKAEKARQRALRRALRRMPENSATGPSKKISIRLPRFLLESIQGQAATLGIPYQTLIKVMLTEATR